MIANSTKILTIGTYDGVHIGHQKILNRVVSLGKKYGLKPSVLTLFPHPRMVLEKENSIQLLNTIEERVELLKEFGIKDVIIKKFDLDFASLSAEDYVKKVLVEELNTKFVVIGYDHHFGKNRSANIIDLKAFSKQYGFDIEEISAQDIKDVTVSSTKIRHALESGEVALANSYLGYNFFITGKVITGKGLGRTLHFPTANIYVKETYKLIPRDGVYVVKSEINGDTVYGMMNIGTNPTVEGTTKSIEVHFFDFDDDIYGQELKVEFLHRLRNEYKFENLQALKDQLKKDREHSLTFIKLVNE